MKRGFLYLSVVVLAFGLCLRMPAQTSIGVTPEWLRYLANGVGGAQSCPPTCTITDEHWVSSYTVAAGATAYERAGNGPIVIRSTGPCTIAGTLGNTPNIGGSVGINVRGDFGGGGGGGGGGATTGGQGGSWTVGNGWVEIENGGAGGAPSGRAGGQGGTPGFLQYRQLLNGGSLWPAGGSIGGQGGGPGGGLPGDGGGPIILVCQTMNFTGTIDVSGGVGSSPTANNAGAGGGGGAGYVILSASNWVANTGTIKLSGGAGGSCAGFTGCGPGGKGGDGWSIAIKIQ
jgi:hypothetical protein